MLYINIVKFDPVVLENMSKLSKVNRQTGGRLVIRKTDLNLRSGELKWHRNSYQLQNYDAFKLR